MVAKTNAERQQAWRDKHRPRKRYAVQFPSIAPTAPPAPPPPQETPLDQLGPEALFENHIRKMQPAKKLYLAMLIMDDLNTLAGKRKARRNQQYIVQAMQCANELAQLPMEETQAFPISETQTDLPLLAG